MTDKILIIDDEPNNLDVLRNCLTEAGFKVSVVDTGETALQLIEHIKPNLILLDVIMPGMDGFETCRRLKNDEVTKDIPIIFITAKTETANKVEGLNMSAVDYITKPFDVIEVIARVKKQLMISRLRQEIEAQNAQLQAYVYHLESLARLRKAIDEATNVTQMMDHAMKITLAVFNCERAWLLYPCDPKAPTWRVPIEITTPEYPGAYFLNKEIEMETTMSEFMTANLSITEPLVLGASYEQKLPSIIAEQFSVQAQMSIVIYPKLGKPWLFGLHQCSYARVWTKNEVDLFREFGQHLSVSLGLSISVEELEKSGHSVRQRYYNLIGGSQPMQTIYQIIDNVAMSQAPLLITGETGTGKELCVEAIHKKSDRANQPLGICNCAAIPKDLLENHLFGHVKGAFTGAMTEEKGLVHYADGGTLFLDEIGELSPSMQSTLLRFAQDGTYSKIGSYQIEKVDVRLICATNRNLPAEIKAGQFREDLYYRINTIEIKLPALRERGQDILLLAEFFVQQFAKKEQKDFQEITPEAAQKLLNYDWPGNVRQLQNTIHHVMLLNEGKVITAQMLDAKINENIDTQNISLPTESTQPIELIKNHATPVVALTSNETFRSLEDIENDIIRAAIDFCQGSVIKAAKMLKVSHGTLYNKIKRWKK
jgi:DNA-binding NtrC family response regulator